VENVLYIGIDVSKAKLDVALTLTGQEIKSRKVVSNNQSGFASLQQYIDNQAKRLDCKKMHYCLEATGIYSEEIAEYLQNIDGAAVTVSNPAAIKSFSKSLFVRTKNDKADAELIAIYVAKMKPNPTQKVDSSMKKFKQLVRYYETLTKRRAQEKTKLESTKSEIIKESINSLITAYDKELKGIQEEIQKIAASSQNISKNIKLLKTISGIGDKTAQLLISEFCIENEDGKLSRKAQSAHAGLAPREKQSGTSIKGQTQICRTGSSLLRTALYMPTMSALKYNPIIKRFYERLVAKGKKKKVALVACMRKLLCIAIGVLNNGKAFDVTWISQRECA
jgi:transposase